MKTTDELDQGMRRLAEELRPSFSVVDTVMERLPEPIAAPAIETPRDEPGRFSIRRSWLGAALAAAVVMAVLVGPWGPGANRNTDSWSGSSAAHGQVLADALGKAVENGVTARETTIIVMPDGARHASSTTGVYFVSHDSYRRDLYDGDVLRSRQWYVPHVETPHGEAMVETSLDYDAKTYTVLRHIGSFGDLDPVTRLKFFVGLVDQADKKLETRTIDGMKCAGFEISASKYGDNPPSWKDRIWFDTETKLPVRIEQERPRDEKEFRAFIHVQDQFNWSPDLPADAFSPVIPEGFSPASSQDDAP